jgi:hypothetical protein
MLKEKFEDITVKSGAEIGLFGMHLCMDQEHKQVVIMQPKHVDWIIKTFKVNKGALSPHLPK